MTDVYPDSHHIYAYVPDQFDLTSYVLGEINGRLGMNSNKPLDLVAQTGTLTIILDNTTNKFTPGHSQALSGWGKGVRIVLEIVFEKVRYYIEGKLGDLNIPTFAQSANFITITVVDWMEHAATHPIVNPGVVTNYKGKQILEYVVSRMSNYINTQFDEGVSLFPTALDTVTSKTKAMSEFTKVAFSDAGYIYLKQGGDGGVKLVFEDRHHRHGWKPLDTIPKSPGNSGKLLKEDGAYLLKEDGGKILLNEVQSYEADETMVGTDVEYGHDVINYLTVQANPRRVDTSPQILFQLDTPIFIGSGITYELKGNYANPVGGEACRGQNMITPVATTDYLANTASDGSGTNKTSAVQLVSISYGTEGFTHQVKNTDTGGIWITKYNTRGYGIYTPNPITHVEKDDISIEVNEEVTEMLNQEYQSTLGDGTALAKKVIELESNPRLVVKKIHMVANRSYNHMQAFLNLGSGSYFHLVDDVVEKDFNAYIQGIEFSINPAGFIRYAWIVKEHKTLMKGLTAIGLEYSGIASNGHDAVDFGALSDISDLSKRSISVWLTALPQTFNNTSIVAFGNVFRFFIDSVTFNISLSIVQTGAGTTTAFYSTASNVMPNDGSLVHLVLTQNVSVWSPSPAQPILYKNAVSQTFNAVGSNTPGGTRTPETGQHFVMGNLYEAGAELTATWLGLIKDLRVYNKILSSSEVTQLYNSGTPDATILTSPESGLVFQAPVVSTDRLSSYINQPLNINLKVRDNVFGFIGTPNDSPIGRAF